MHVTKEQLNELYKQAWRKARKFSGAFAPDDKMIDRYFNEHVSEILGEDNFPVDPNDRWRVVSINHLIFLSRDKWTPIIGPSIDALVCYQSKEQKWVIEPRGRKGYVISSLEETKIGNAIERGDVLYRLNS